MTLTVDAKGAPETASHGAAQTVTGSAVEVFKMAVGRAAKKLIVRGSCTPRLSVFRPAFCRAGNPELSSRWVRNEGPPSLRAMLAVSALRGRCAPWPGNGRELDQFSVAGNVVRSIGRGSGHGSSAIPWASQLLPAAGRCLSAVRPLSLRSTSFGAQSFKV